MLPGSGTTGAVFGLTNVAVDEVTIQNDLVVSVRGIVAGQVSKVGSTRDVEDGQVVTVGDLGQEFERKDSMALV